MEAYILTIIGLRSLSVGPSSPFANEKSLGKMWNFCTTDARLIAFLLILFIPIEINKNECESEKKFWKVLLTEGFILSGEFAWNYKKKIHEFAWNQIISR
jgi:hypothetical protein